MVKKCVDADYSALTEETETNPKSAISNLGDRVRILSTKAFLAKFMPNICQKKYL